MTDSTRKKLSLPVKWVKVPAELLTDVTLSAQELRIWAVLKGHCPKKDSCDPGVKRLCDFTGLTDRWVRNSLIELERKGYLRRVLRTGLSSLYFPLPEDEPRNCNTGHPGTGVPDQKGTPELEFQEPRNCTTDKIEVLKQNEETPQPSASSSPNGKSPKKASKEKGDPRVESLLSYFRSAYERLIGHAYSPSYGRDKRMLKSLLADHSEQTLQACIDIFFTDQEGVWQNGRRSVPTFLTKINDLIKAISTRQASPTPAAHRPLQ